MSGIIHFGSIFIAKVVGMINDYIEQSPLKFKLVIQKA